MTGKFVLYEDQAGEFRFRLKAANGEQVAQGDGYSSRAAAEEGCEAVKRAAIGATIEDERAEKPVRW